MNIHPNNKKMLRKARKMRNREMVREITAQAPSTARRDKRKKFSDWVNEVGEFA